jgi:hypothetical protein
MECGSRLVMKASRGFGPKEGAPHIPCERNAPPRAGYACGVYKPRTSAILWNAVLLTPTCGCSNSRAHEPVSSPAASSLSSLKGVTKREE